ncbi:hypothetical protein PR003_g21579 [Phytophthora rubi]|uniref:Uncharacterized protein n=1 Tax=Phytophthora rubi TaxID=129364 RepID=A0A6A3J7U4_9STRA|nr:hypothetical protein PR002_g20877 [Phytophthora rubi]KAE9305143.1 hypothetical protein PR003_g21579 [Phytophthora rubi]
MASSSASDCGGSRALPAPPPPASSSSDSAASTTTAGSSSSSSAASTISLENASNSSKFQHNSQASSSSSTLIQSVSVGDSTDNPTASSSGSCSDAEVEIDPVTPQPTDWTASDPCRYYPVHSDGCTNPRSCRDCLNLEADGDLSCMVNQYGRCVQKNGATYVPALDFRHQQPSNSCEQRSDQKVQFPADKVDYCPYGDTQCQRCKDSVFADVMQGRINGSLTKFCYGDGGCVCIAVCEAPIWKSTVGQTVCNGTVVNRDFDSQHANTYGGSNGAEDHDRQPMTNLLLEIVGAIAAVAVVVAAVQFARKRRRTSDDAASSSSQEGGEDSAAAEGAADAPMAVPVAPQLSLFGWQAMRSELIEREQLLLAGVEDFSNVRTGYLQLLDVDASAPPPEEDESSAPVLLVPLAGASAPTFSPRGVAALASAPSAPPVSPSAPTLLEEELL